MSGLEKLKEAVLKDCDKEQRTYCFNENGCNYDSRSTEGNDELQNNMLFIAAKNTSKCSHKYCDKFKWTVDRAKHYGEKMGLNWEDVLDSWEEDRSYWYMNYYQECNQPLIDSDKVRVFDTFEELADSLQGRGFICPMCGGTSSNPYSCNSGLEMSMGETCDWKVYGLFGDLGKGIFVYCKDKLKGETIFMPVAWKDDAK